MIASQIRKKIHNRELRIHEHGYFEGIFMVTPTLDTYLDPMLLLLDGALPQAVVLLLLLLFQLLLSCPRPRLKQQPFILYSASCPHCLGSAVGSDPMNYVLCPVLLSKVGC